MVIDTQEAAGGPPVPGAATGMVSQRFTDGHWVKESVPVPREMALPVFINGKELVTMLCTPNKLIPLVVGFLYSEGIISDTNDIASMRVCEEESVADIRLVNSDYKPPERRTIGSGCGGGVSFQASVERVNSDLVVGPTQILSLMKQLPARAELYRYCGGVHTAALCDPDNILVVAEDIGRHNTLDKIIGECLLTGASTRDRLLLTTGRLSSEMLTKAARMGTPVVFSRSSPTDRSISLAHDLGITLVGYVRGNRLSVYSHSERLQALPQ